MFSCLILNVMYQFSTIIWDIISSLWFGLMDFKETFLTISMINTLKLATFLNISFPLFNGKYTFSSACRLYNIYLEVFQFSGVGLKISSRCFTKC